MELQQLWAQVGSYALVGAIVSSIIQFTKGWIGSRSGKVMWSFLISIGIGMGIYFARLLPGEMVTVVAGIIAASNTVYALFFKGTEK